MSVAIITQGKFIPAAGGQVKVVTKVIDRGSSYGGEWNRKKAAPQVVVNMVADEDKVKDKPDVMVVSVEES